MNPFSEHSEKPLCLSQMVRKGRWVSLTFLKIAKGRRGALGYLAPPKMDSRGGSSRTPGLPRLPLSAASCCFPCTPHCLWWGPLPTDEWLLDWPPLLASLLVLPTLEHMKPLPKLHSKTDWLLDPFYLQVSNAWPWLHSLSFAAGFLPLVSSPNTPFPPSQGDSFLALSCSACPAPPFMSQPTTELCASGTYNSVLPLSPAQGCQTLKHCLYSIGPHRLPCFDCPLPNSGWNLTATLETEVAHWRCG